MPKYFGIEAHQVFDLIPFCMLIERAERDEGLTGSMAANELGIVSQSR
jgi:hypothetical protein